MRSDSMWGNPDVIHSKVPLPEGDMDLQLTQFLRPPESTPNGISVGSATFAGFTIVTQTDRLHYSVRSNRRHLDDAAMWPNNSKSR